MGKNIKFNNYSENPQTVIDGQANLLGTASERIAWYCDQFYAGSKSSDIYLNDTAIGASRAMPAPAIFTFTSRGADTGTLSLFYPESEHGKIVKATGNVKLGADGNLTEQVINGGVTNTFIVTCLSDTGTLVLPNTYTRFSANIIDTNASNGWATTASSPSLAFDIATFPIGLITFNCLGANTISGNLPADWKSIRYFYLAGGNTVSGNLPSDWKSMYYFLCTGSNIISGNLPSDWGSITYFSCQGSNTLSGNLPADWKSLGLLNLQGSNTVSGNFPADWKSMRYFICRGQNTISGITDGEYAGNGSMQYLLLNSDNNLGGLSAEDQESLLINKATRTWSGTVFNLASTATAMESMADTAIPGRWFSVAGDPTEVALALKTLVIEKNVTVSLKGLTMPGASGDGAGFPTGFGNWWRS